MENTNNNAGGNRTAGSRSTFVSVVAWIFIALSAMSLLSGVVVAVVVDVAVRDGFFQRVFAQMSAAATAHVPPWALFMFHHVRWFVVACLLIVLVELLAAIGLLLRKEWGRQLFIVFMVGAILWQLVNLGIQLMYSSGALTMASMPANVPVDITQGFEVFNTVARVFSVVVTLAFCVLYGWIVKRLVSPKIRAEFG